MMKSATVEDVTGEDIDQAAFHREIPLAEVLLTEAFIMRLSQVSSSISTPEPPNQIPPQPYLLPAPRHLVDW